MKERGILFKGEMVRAILDGRKTQTRRVVTPQPVRRPIPCHWSGTGWALEGLPNDRGIKGCSCHPVKSPPYGQTSDRLWVRETWAQDDDDILYYRADSKKWTPGKWTPSIHMPRWASRTTLAIITVRVERLQDISEGDIVAEGVPMRKTAGMFAEDERLEYLLEDFINLWDSIAKPGEQWDDNPWVWVYEFKKLEAD